MDKKINLGNGKEVLERLEKDRISGASKKANEKHTVLVEYPYNCLKKGDKSENFDEANIADVRASIENDDPMAKNNGKAYSMIINQSGPVEVKISEKGRKICADLLLGNADDVVKSFEEKGALKGEPEKVVRLVEPSTAGQVNMKPVRISDENLHKSMEDLFND
jgi:hypothetical protein